LSEWLEAPPGLRLVAWALVILGVLGVSGFLFQVTDAVGVVLMLAGAVLIVWIGYFVTGVRRGKKPDTEKLGVS